MNKQTTKRSVGRPRKYLTEEERQEARKLDFQRHRLASRDLMRFVKSNKAVFVEFLQILLDKKQKS